MTRPAPPDTIHVAIRLRASLSALARQLRVHAPADGPGTARLVVLGELYRRGALAPTQIATHAGVKVQTLTRLLAAMEADGLVSRQADAADARRTLLSLTGAGAQALAHEVHRREASLAGALAAVLDAGERARLLDACDLMDRLAAAALQPPPDTPLPAGQDLPGDRAP